MRLNNRSAMLVFTCLMAGLGIVFAAMVMSVTRPTMAQSGSSELPSSFGPTKLENLAAGGPTINMTPKTDVAVGNHATVNVQITNTGDVTLTWLRTDYEPSKPAYVVDSTCDRLGADAVATFGPDRSLAPHASISYTCVVTMVAVSATYPFTLRVRSADPADPQPLVPFLGDSDTINIVVTIPNLTPRLWLPIVRHGS